MSLTSVSIQTVYNHKYQLRFNKEGWCVQEMYWYFLYENNFDGKGCQKAVVRLDDIGKQNDEITFNSDVAVLTNVFDFDLYFKKGKAEKKQILLEALHSGLMNIAQKFNWDTQLLMDAKEYCLQNNIQNKRLLYGKYKFSPNRAYKGGVFYYWDIDLFEVYAVILDKSEKELVKEKIITKEPHQGEFIYYTKTKWLDKNTFALINKNGDSWNVKIES